MDVRNRIAELALESVATRSIPNSSRSINTVVKTVTKDKINREDSA
jgi:hypothetical protein